MKRLICPLALLLMAPVRAQNAMVVDAGKVTGTIRSLQGVNCGPLNLKRNLDLTAWYRRLRIDTIRTHDYYGPFDIPAIFADQTKSATDPSSYDFQDSDTYMKGIVDSGAVPFLRLGISWNQKGWALQMSLDKLAEVCRRIVMHYNAGWASGYRYGITHVEFWNEPNGPGFWPGTAADFFQAYEKTVSKLKGDDASLIVGACGLAGYEDTAYREAFISYCAKNSVPLDFYSWHLYGTRDRGKTKTPHPFDVVNNSRAVQAVLDANGMKTTGQILSEWNVALGSDRGTWLQDVAGAAYCASTLIYMQDTEIDKAHHYRGDVHGGGVGGMGLFSDGSTPQARAWVFQMNGGMLLTSRRLEVTGADQDGFTALAGANGDGSEVRILVADYQGTTTTRSLQVDNLPSGRWLVERWGMSVGTPKYQRLDSGLMAVSGSLSLSLPSGRYVQQVRITKANGTGPVLRLADPMLPYQGARGDFVISGAPPGATYIVAMSASGSQPGFRLPGGPILPLNYDVLTDLGLALLGTPSFRDLSGTVPASGTLAGSFDFGKLPAIAISGEVTYAGVFLSGARFAAVTNADSAKVR